MAELTDTVFESWRAIQTAVADQRLRDQITKRLRGFTPSRPLSPDYQALLALVLTEAETSVPAGPVNDVAQALTQLHEAGSFLPWFSKRASSQPRRWSNARP